MTTKDEIIRMAKDAASLCRSIGTHTGANDEPRKDFPPRGEGGAGASRRLRNEQDSQPGVPRHRTDGRNLCWGMT